MATNDKPDGRDNLTHGADYLPGVVDTFTVIRTENQIKAGEGFAPHYIRQRQPNWVSEDGRGDMRLARLPGWMERDDLPCAPPTFHWWVMTDDQKERHWDTGHADKAAELCAGCPVLEECLADALAREGSKHYGERALVRGGLTPKGRWELSQMAQGDYPVSVGLVRGD